MLERLKDLFNSAADNLSFILMCILIFAGLFLLALLAERYFIKMERYRRRSKYIACVGMMSTVAAILMLFEIPLFFAPAFYEVDLSELPILICTFALGPVAGVVCEFLKIFIKLIIKGTTTAFVGDFANFVVGCSLVLPASIIYHKIKTKKGALIAMAGGTLSMTIFGSLFNAVYLIPTFSKLFGLPLENIIAMGTAVNSNITSLSTLVLYAVVPFNLLKGIIVSAITFLLYKRVSGALHMKNSYSNSK
ncbi:MAG TPA: ECF transporter S component [Clostridiales bacterium]|nr:ECF transporter S component [Clostridiales bacterium]